MNWPVEPPTPTYILRLFVAGTTTRSQKAISCTRQICETYLSGRFDLEVIDVYTNPEATRQYQIVATPTLVKIGPEPLRRIIGDLSELSKVLAALNISSAERPSRVSS